ncbi:MAG: hypothetical protein HYU41_04265 [Candidatus Rokubacteria bacterium]|nr:hypothetical protein [Candidatus Rokubacteria bacterium]
MVVALLARDRREHGDEPTRGVLADDGEHGLAPLGVGLEHGEAGELPAEIRREKRLQLVELGQRLGGLEVDDRQLEGPVPNTARNQVSSHSAI